MSQVAKAPAAPIEVELSHRRSIDMALTVVKSPVFVPSFLLVVAWLFSFWDLLKTLPDLYFDKDGYYSHGFFMPLTAAYVIYKNWPKLKTIPVTPSWFALIPLAGILYLLRPADATMMLSFMSILMVFSIFFGVWFVAGIRWALSVAVPTFYLLLGLPIWSMAINTYTNPLQLLSTKVSFWMLELTGFRPFQDGTYIHLNHFNLDVGVPCSGLKLVVALSAFTMFFMMIAKLRVWANVVLAGLVFPMALLFNGLRIAMIGAVGEIYGEAAGHQFHDYSGYIMLLVCFFSFYKIVRLLGWKD